jgi:hypothetical protein
MRRNEESELRRNEKEGKEIKKEEEDRRLERRKMVVAP